MVYRVRKNKFTRISYRIVGVFFILVALLQVWAVTKMESGAKLFLIMLSVVIAWYGGYLFKMSFRRQAYDIIYEFEEAGIRLNFRKGSEEVPYAAVQDVQIIAPDPDLPYRIVKIKIHDENYVLSFPDNIQLSEKIFQYVYSRLENPEV